MMNRRFAKLAFTAIVGALYVVLTMCVIPLASGFLQFRISEALCVLPAFVPISSVGLFIGCLLSNLITGALWQDVLFGSLATLIGAIGSILLRKHPFLIPLPTILANSLIVPFILCYAYRMEMALPLCMLTVFCGEAVCAYGLGLPFYLILKKKEERLFSAFQK